LEACVATTAVAAPLPAATSAQAQQAPPARTGAQPPSGADGETFQTLHPSEAAFFSAAVDTIIPADDLSPSGTECGVVTFIDRQLAGAWGSGAKCIAAGRSAKASRSKATSLR